jgi:hypothetical protein
LSQSHIRTIAEGYAPELFLQRRAISEIEGLIIQNIRLFVHFPIAGLLLEVK